MRKHCSVVLFSMFLCVLLSACARAPQGTEIVLTAQAEEIPADDDTVTEAQESADTGEAAAPSAEISNPEPAASPAVIVVHVCGAVRCAGVYTMPEGSRVYEAVAMAGGFAGDADEACINQAEVLSDGVRLRIPTREETAAVQDQTGRTEDAGLAVISGGESEKQTAGGGGGKININTADAETLCRLQGVGPSTAQKIIAYREANGRFTKIEDIMLVSGIKEKLFAKIREDITVSG